MKLEGDKGSKVMSAAMLHEIACMRRNGAGQDNLGAQKGGKLERNFWGRTLGVLWSDAGVSSSSSGGSAALADGQAGQSMASNSACAAASGGGRQGSMCPCQRSQTCGRQASRQADRQGVLLEMLWGERGAGAQGMGCSEGLMFPWH